MYRKKHSIYRVQYYLLLVQILSQKRHCSHYSKPLLSVGDTVQDPQWYLKQQIVSWNKVPLERLFRATENVREIVHLAGCDLWWAKGRQGLLTGSHLTDYTPHPTPAPPLAGAPRLPPHSPRPMFLTLPSLGTTGLLNTLNAISEYSGWGFSFTSAGPLWDLWTTSPFVFR